MKNNVLNTVLLLFSCLAFISMALLRNAQQKEWKIPAKYEKMENPFANTPDDDDIGKVLYTKHCKSCHGSKGKGDGTKAAGLDTPVPDFTEEAFSNQTDGSLYYKTVFGRDDMPSFEKKIMEEEDRWMVVNYIKKM